MSISILLVDDHPVFLFGMRTLIQAEADMTLVGEAMSGAEALEQINTYQPDVVIVDINLPDMNGVEITRRVRHDHPNTRVLVLTMQDDQTVFNALKAGAGGYILKGTGGEETLRAIRAVAGGESIFSTSIARRIVQHFDKASNPTAFPELTERESEILELLAQGLTNTAIAERQSLSVKTVRNRVSDIFSKLHVSDRASAITRSTICSACCRVSAATYEGISTASRQIDTDTRLGVTISVTSFLFVISDQSQADADVVMTFTDSGPLPILPEQVRAAER